ncbi:hypothetical protein BX666DRAFT_2023199 [Dichotomocladium elegans]|nr:hypothetical protein BX666DRAFT_2023199 [Dichotomocladium elegans]
MAALTSLSRKVMRILRGFSPQQGHFLLPRAAVAPSADLWKKILLQVDYYPEEIEPTQVSAAVFLQFLGAFRLEFLQPTWRLCAEAFQPWPPDEHQNTFKHQSAISNLGSSIPLLNRGLTNNHGIDPRHRRSQNAKQKTLPPTFSRISDGYAIRVMERRVAAVMMIASSLAVTTTIIKAIERYARAQGISEKTTSEFLASRRVNLGMRLRSFRQ